MAISPILVFDVDGRVVVYDNLNDAEQPLEAIDINDDEYPDRLRHRRACLPSTAPPRQRTASPLDRTDIADLHSRLSRAYGPRHLANNPGANADEILRD